MAANVNKCNSLGDTPAVNNKKFKKTLKGKTDTYIAYGNTP